MKTIAFFNNKGGVGKTSLVYHLAWMFAEIGINVVAVDLDPQSNLTSSFLEDDALEKLWVPDSSSSTILGVIQQLIDRMGDITDPQLIPVSDRIGLVAGDLGLSLFEDRLATTWGLCLDDNPANSQDAFRVTTAFYRVMEQAAEQQDAKLVLIDLGPNLGAINRAALVASDYVVIPLAADLFSLQGLKNLGPTLRSWRGGWQKRREVYFGEKRQSSAKSLSLPQGSMTPAGYVVMQPSIRENYPVKAYHRWMQRIPEVYRLEVLDTPHPFDVPDPDPLALATLKNYRSLAPMAQEARKPMFALKPSDGAIGGHVAAVQDCFRVFSGLAERIAESCKVSLPRAKKAKKS